MIKSILSIIISFLIVVLISPKFIPFLTRLKMGQTIRELGPKSHYTKAGTPTMGGLVMFFALIITSLVFSKYVDKSLIFAIFVTLIFGFVGFLDDYIKLVQKQKMQDEKGVLVPYLGMQPKQKLLLQFSIAAAVSIYAAFHPSIGTELLIPFSHTVLNFSKILFIPFTMIAIVAVVNAANLTDGLDGLASGVTGIILLFFFFVAMSVGYLSMGVFAGSLIGACLGFLCFNAYPAKVFMGDTGSMALGAGVVVVAILTKTQLFILIAGLIYVIEALSVLLQVGYFKLTKGKRLFKMAPIHHHFELCGIAETKIVIMFWIASIILVCTSIVAYLV